MMIPGLGHESGDATRVATPMDTGIVLVVDESSTVRAKLAEILHKLGTPASSLVEASTPDEALAAFRAHHPSLVFAELIGVHPEDGLEIIHEMLDAGQSARIVLVSAESRESPEVRAAIRAGVFAFVEKPLRYEKIRQVLADLETEEGGIERLR